MARNFPADTRAQKALEELYEKEVITQLKWFLKYEEIRKKNGAAPVTASMLQDTQVPNVKELLEKLKLHSVKESDIHDQGKEKETDTLTESANLENFKLEENEEEVDLKAKAKLKTLELLYDGISKDGKGRYLYLKERNKLSNEEKYQYPILSSMEYGWESSNSNKTKIAAVKQFERSNIIKDSFYRRTGIPFKHGADMLELNNKTF